MSDPKIDKDVRAKFRIIPIGPFTTNPAEHLLSVVANGPELIVGKRVAAGDNFFLVDPRVPSAKGFNKNAAIAALAFNGATESADAESGCIVAANAASANVFDFRNSAETFDFGGGSPTTVDVRDAGGCARALIIEDPNGTDAYAYLAGANAAGTQVNIFKLAIDVRRFLDTPAPVSLNLVTATVTASHITICTDNLFIWVNVARYDSGNDRWESRTFKIDPLAMTILASFTLTGDLGTNIIWDINYMSNPECLIYSGLKRLSDIQNIGSAGSGNGQFNAPVGIAFDSAGNFYVTDSGNKRVQKFNSAGTYQAQWAMPANYIPHGICIDAADGIYVTMNYGGNSYLKKYNISGTELASLAFNSTSLYGVGADSDYVYVYEYIDGTHSYVRKILQDLSAAGSRIKTLSLAFPEGTIAVDEFGYIFVGVNMPVGAGVVYPLVKIDKLGNLKLQSSTSAGGGVVKDSINQILYASDGLATVGNIYKNNTAANIIKQLLNYNAPYGMAFDSNNILYVVLKGDNKILKFRQLESSIGTMSLELQINSQVHALPELNNANIEAAGALYCLVAEERNRFYALSDNAQVIAFSIDPITYEIQELKRTGVPTWDSDNINPSYLSRLGPMCVNGGFLYLPYQYNQLLEGYIGD